MTAHEDGLCLAGLYQPPRVAKRPLERVPPLAVGHVVAAALGADGDGGAYCVVRALHEEGGAEPMNATGGSLVTVVKYLLSQGVKPKSIAFFNTISTLKGSIRVTRALENCTCYTLWMDPVMNEKAYIMPGLGDAGDRLNGCDTKEKPRNIIQLLSDYGHNISSLYRSQMFEIERTVLG